MADAIDANPATCVEVPFKWKENRESVDATGQPANPTTPPGPDLRRHVVENGRVRDPFHAARERNVETSRIHENDEIGSSR